MPRGRVVARAISRSIGLLVLCMPLAGCLDAYATRDKSVLHHKSPSLMQASTVRAPTADVAEASDVDTQDPARQPMLVKGQVPNLQQQEKRPVLMNADVDGAQLSFSNTPIAEVAMALLGDLLGHNVVIGEGVNGNLTLRSAAPIAKTDMLDVLESALLAQGVVLLQTQQGFEIRMKERAMGALNPRIQVQAGYGVEVIQLRYLQVSEFSAILKPIARAGMVLHSDPMRGLLVLSGSRADRQRWRDTARLFDVDRLAGRSVGVFPLRHQLPEPVIEQLSLILKEGEKDARVQFLAMHESRAILAVAHQDHYLPKIQRWVAQLDKPKPQQASELFVYKVRNRSAESLVQVVQPVLQSLQAAAAIKGGAATNLSSAGAVSALDAGGTDVAVSDAGVSARASAGVQVVADPEKNAVLVFAAGAKRALIERTLKALDTPPQQVIIEASIIDVKLSEELKYGLEWYFRNGIGNSTGNGRLDLGSTIAGSALGFSYSMVSSGNVVQALLNALAEDNRINVVSSPSLMVLDNHTAEINVGDQQPVQTATTETQSGTQLTSIELKDTGVKLQVKPSVNPGGLVTLQVAQSVIDVGEEDSITGQRSFLRREVNSTVAVQSGQTIVLGGLISTRHSNEQTGIPALHKMPVVGALFGSEYQASSRNELVVLLTPRVLETPQDGDKVFEDYQRSLSMLNL